MNFYCNFLNRKDKLQFDANSIGLPRLLQSTCLSMFIRITSFFIKLTQEKGVGWMGLGGGATKSCGGGTSPGLWLSLHLACGAHPSLWLPQSCLCLAPPLLPKLELPNVQGPAAHLHLVASNNLSSIELRGEWTGSGQGSSIAAREMLTTTSQKMKRQPLLARGVSICAGSVCTPQKSSRRFQSVLPFATSFLAGQVREQEAS